MQNFWSFPTRCAQLAALACALCPPGHARVTRIVIDETSPMAARGPGSEPVTGEVLGRIVNRVGPASQALLVQTMPIRLAHQGVYKPLC